MSKNGDHRETSVQDEGVTDCLKAVENYRGNHISKWDAISQITTSIRSSTASTYDEQRASAGGTYRNA